MIAYLGQKHAVLLGFLLTGTSYHDHTLVEGGWYGDMGGGAVLIAYLSQKHDILLTGDMMLRHDHIGRLMSD